MAKDDVLPTPDDLVGAAVTAIAAKRPKALRWLNHYELTRSDGRRSRYATVVGAWRAQAIVACNRLASELAARFLSTAEGQGLRELVAEPDFGSLVLDESASFAYGTAVLHRLVDGTTTFTYPAGVIPAGTRFKRPANPSAIPIPIPAAEYVSTSAVVVDNAVTSISIPVKAVRQGPDANVVLEPGVTGIQGVSISDRLYDVEQADPTQAKFFLYAFDCAGGSKGLRDDDLRRIAKGQAGGLAGPTKPALRAGALRVPGVTRLAIFDSLVDDDNATRPNSRIFVADDSWASSAIFRNAVLQFLSDDWAGWGLRITSGTIYNTFIRVECAVQLRHASKLTDTSQIAADILEAVRAYFDDRENWWEWSLSQLRAVISNANREILTCTSATVKDRLGNVIPEPTVNTASDTVIQHFYLLAGGVSASFTGPA